MSFDSRSPSRLPTPGQITDLSDLMASGRELHQIYSTLARHPRIITSPKALELFISCCEQLQEDLDALKTESSKLLALPSDPSVDQTQQRRNRPAAFAQEDADIAAPFHFTPDVEPVDVTQSIFEIMKRSFRVEPVFTAQLAACLASAEGQNQLRLQLQLKMIKLSAAQRNQLLNDRYGYAKSKSLLFQGLRRQTTRFLSAISGEQRNDIDR